VKILVISHSCVIDVNQQVYVDLAALPDTDVRLIVPANWRSEYTGEALEARVLPSVTFPVYRLPVARPGSVNLHFYKKLPMGELRAWKPDVVLASQEPYSLSGGQGLWLARRLGARFAFQTNQNILKKYPPPFSFIESACFRHAAVAMAYSEEARQVMARKGRTENTAVVPYFTDVRLFTPPTMGDKDWAREVSERREQLGLGGAVVVGYLGRLVPEKGLDILLDALARLKTKTPVKALLVGTGVAEEALKAQAAALGLTDRVAFAGVVPHAEAGRYMACADILALPSRTTPSWKEQFGRVIIEALACGLPVVGSDSGEIPHLIRATGGGRVFREGDADDLAAKLTELADAPALRAELARVGGAAVRERYTSEAVARQLRGLFAADGGGRP
jgi:glycosyltransferase involved in cell wall biosynthesis